MTLNSDAKFEWTQTLQFQKWHEELGGLSLQYSKIRKIVYWWALFVQRIYVSPRKFQRNYVSWHWRVYDAKFKGQLTCGLKNDIRNLESLHFDVLLFSIAYKVSTKKSIKELSLLTLKKDLNFEENCLFFWKMISEILWTLTRAVESL